jgi:hypothetical protein
MVGLFLYSYYLITVRSLLLLIGIILKSYGLLCVKILTNRLVMVSFSN